MSTDTGIPVGGFIGIVITMIILNVAGVILYYKFMSNRALPVRIDSALGPMLRYGTVGLLFLSWIFSISSTVPCTFVKVMTTTVITSAFTGVPVQIFTNEFYLGLDGVEVNGVCHREGIHDDARIETAYAFGVINILLTTTALIGCLLVVVNVVIKDVIMANKVWFIMGFLTFASTWCCLFTFYIQESVSCTGIVPSTTIECSLAGAGVAQVFNSMFLIGICVLFFVTPSLTAEGDGNDGEGGGAVSKTAEEEIENGDANNSTEEEDDKKEQDGDGEPISNNTEEENKKNEQQDGNIEEIEDGSIEEIDLGDDTRQPSS